MTTLRLAGLALASAGLTLLTQPPAPGAQADGWPYYGHDGGGMRYSPLAQIARDNVSRLKVAWVFHTGDVSEGKDGRRRTEERLSDALVAFALM